MSKKVFIEIEPRVPITYDVLCEADDDDPEYIAAKVARELLV